MARQDDLFKYVANTNGASCVVFRPSRQSKDLYLITAYHALEDEEHPTDNKILDEIVIRVSDVNINLDDYSYTCIYQSLPEDYDLLVFEIHNISNEDIEFHYLDIYHGDFERSVVVGYPQVKHLKDNTIKSFDTSSSVNTNGKHKNYRYTVSSNTSLFTENSNDMDSTKGFSGGGVFVLGADDDYHLAGIVIEAEYYSAFEYISISSLLRKINKQSKIEKIPSYKKQFFNEYNIDSNPDSLKEIIKKIMCSENEYFKDYSPQEPIDSHIEAQKNTISSKARTLNGQRKSLSEYYLFLGIHYHLEQKFSQSTKYFNRAVEFDIAKQEIFKSVAFDRKQIKSSKSARDKNISLFKGQALDRDEQKRLTEKVIIYTLARDTEDPRSISRLNDKDSDDLDKMLRSYLSNTNPEYKLEANYILAQLDKKTGERQVYCKKVIEVFLDNPIDDFTLYVLV